MILIGSRERRAETLLRTGKYSPGICFCIIFPYKTSGELGAILMNLNVCLLQECWDAMLRTAPPYVFTASHGLGNGR